jgi:hypothetical protein
MKNEISLPTLLSGNVRFHSIIILLLFEGNEIVMGDLRLAFSHFSSMKRARGKLQEEKEKEK